MQYPTWCCHTAPCQLLPAYSCLLPSLLSGTTSLTHSLTSHLLGLREEDPNILSHVLYIGSHLLCWTSGGGATNSPPHVLYLGISSQIAIRLRANHWGKVGLTSALQHRPNVVLTGGPHRWGWADVEATLDRRFCQHLPTIWTTFCQPFTNPLPTFGHWYSHIIFTMLDIIFDALKMSRKGHI